MDAIYRSISIANTPTTHIATKVGKDMTQHSYTTEKKVDGVVIGVVAAPNSSREPLVAYSGNQSELPVVAKSTVLIDSTAIGREVALLFEGGDITRPIIMGLIQNEMLEEVDLDADKQSEPKALSVEIGLPNTEANKQELTSDGERIVLQAKKEIVLKCGKSSITMTRAGKVIIRGTYISTRSSGANRIKGGSVQIN